MMLLQVKLPRDQGYELRQYATDEINCSSVTRGPLQQFSPSGTVQSVVYASSPETMDTGILVATDTSAIDVFGFDVLNTGAFGSNRSSWLAVNSTEAFDSALVLVSSGSDVVAGTQGGMVVFFGAHKVGEACAGSASGAGPDSTVDVGSPVVHIGVWPTTGDTYIVSLKSAAAVVVANGSLVHGVFDAEPFAGTPATSSAYIQQLSMVVVGAGATGGKSGHVFFYDSDVTQVTSNLKLKPKRVLDVGVHGRAIVDIGVVGDCTSSAKHDFCLVLLTSDECMIFEMSKIKTAVDKGGSIPRLNTVKPDGDLRFDAMVTGLGQPAWTSGLLLAARSATVRFFATPGNPGDPGVPLDPVGSPIALAPLPFGGFCVGTAVTTVDGVRPSIELFNTSVTQVKFNEDRSKPPILLAAPEEIAAAPLSPVPGSLVAVASGIATVWPQGVVGGDSPGSSKMVNISVQGRTQPGAVLGRSSGGLWIGNETGVAVFLRWDNSSVQPEYFLPLATRVDFILEVIDKGKGNTVIVITTDAVLLVSGGESSPPVVSGCLANTTSEIVVAVALAADANSHKTGALITAVNGTVLVYGSSMLKDPAGGGTQPGQLVLPDKCARITAAAEYSGGLAASCAAGAIVLWNTSQLELAKRGQQGEPFDTMWAGDGIENLVFVDSTDQEDMLLAGVFTFSPTGPGSVCVAGTFSGFGAECSPCPLGFYSGAGAETCALTTLATTVQIWAWHVAAVAAMFVFGLFALPCEWFKFFRSKGASEQESDGGRSRSGGFSDRSGSRETLPKQELAEFVDPTAAACEEVAPATVGTPRPADCGRLQPLLPVPPRAGESTAGSSMGSGEVSCPGNLMPRLQSAASETSAHGQSGDGSWRRRTRGLAIAALCVVIPVLAALVAECVVCTRPPGVLLGRCLCIATGASLGVVLVRIAKISRTSKAQVWADGLAVLLPVSWMVLLLSTLADEMVAVIHHPNEVTRISTPFGLANLSSRVESAVTYATALLLFSATGLAYKILIALRTVVRRQPTQERLGEGVLQPACLDRMACTDYLQLRRLLRFARSWHGRHWYNVAHSIVYLIVFVPEFWDHMTYSGGSETVKVLLLVILATVVEGVVSGASLLSARWRLSMFEDRHFRACTLVQSIFVILKLMYLMSANQAQVTSPQDIAFQWSCRLEEACPSWCTAKAGGVCLPFSATDAGLQCSCSYFGASNQFSEYVIITQTLCGAILKLGYTVWRVVFMLRRNMDPRPVFAYGTITAAPQIIIFATAVRINLLALVTQGSLRVSLHDTLNIERMVSVTSPCVMLLMFANELRWEISRITPGRTMRAQSRSSGGVEALRPLALGAAVLGVLLSAMFFSVDTSDLQGPPLEWIANTSDIQGALNTSMYLASCVAALAFPGRSGMKLPHWEPQGRAHRSA